MLPAIAHRHPLPVSMHASFPSTHCIVSDGQELRARCLRKVIIYTQKILYFPVCVRHCNSVQEGNAWMSNIEFCLLKLYRLEER